jgi:phosphoglycerate dehydrogenase-like enzyme
MSTGGRQLRAAITRAALDAVVARVPAEVEVVELEALERLDLVDFLVPGWRDPRVLEALPGLARLSVVQVLSAGTDWIEHSVPPQAILCNARGARDAPVAEWVVGALLGAASGLLESAHERRWRPSVPAELGGWTVLVVGIGSIGRAVQARLRPIGSEVIGVASRARDGVHGVDELLALLPRADAVVVLTPLTDATRGLIGTPELAAMADGALLINAARGEVVDTDALLAELSAGRLRAVLDVTDPEPLPEGHPLWSAPGVLAITPHIAGDSRAGDARAVALAGDQLIRWLAGEPLRGVVDRR